MVIPIGCHISTKHAQMGTGISGSIILDKFRWLQLGRHDNLGDIGQTIKINASSGAWTLHNVHLFRKGFHLVLNLTSARLWGLILRRIHFLFPLCGPMGGVVQSLFGFSGGVSFLFNYIQPIDKNSINAMNLIFRVCLDTVYFVEIKKLLLKVR